MKARLIFTTKSTHTSIVVAEVREMVEKISQWAPLRVQPNVQVKTIYSFAEGKFAVEINNCILEGNKVEQSIFRLLEDKRFTNYILERIEISSPYISVPLKVDTLYISDGWKSDAALSKIMEKCKLTKDTTAKTLLIAMRKVSAAGLGEELKTLLKYTRPHIDARDERAEQRKTAMHWAVAGGKIEIIKELLENGASVEIPDASGMTPFDCATTKTNNNALLELLIPKNYVLSYEKFCELLVRDETIPVSFVNLIYHAMNKIMLENPLKEKKFLFLIRNGLKIKIDKISALNGKDSTDADARASHQGNINTITFYYYNHFSFLIDIERAISHEFEHAYKWQIHARRYNKNPSQFYEPVIASAGFAVPFYPRVISESLKFRSKIAKGDEKILKDFYDLLSSESQGIQLDSSQQDRLLIYKKALKNYKPKLVRYNFSMDYDQNFTDPQFQTRINSGSDKYVVSVKADSGLYVPFYIEKVEIANNFIITYGYYANDINDETEKAFAFIYEIAVRKAGMGDLYKNENKYTIQSEIHARTIGELPQETIECFYSSVLKYDEKDERKALTM